MKGAMPMLKRDDFIRLKGVRDCIKRIKEGARALLKINGTDVDKAAHEGQPVAQYIAYTEELNHWLEKKLEVERRLALTKQTQARRKLVRKKALIEQEIMFYKNLQNKAIHTEPDERRR